MKTATFASLCAPLCALCVGLAFPASAQTLYFAGDSTLDEHGGDESTYASWGSGLRPVLLEGRSIENYGKSGRSTTSFIREGWWGAITNSLVAGDFVVIQFGHNDQKLNDASVATPIPQYKDNLLRMAADVQAKGATPVFATPIVRLTYGGDGKLVDNEDLDAWAEAMRETATELGADLVDMRAMTREAANEAGETEALTWYAPGDRTHPAVKGARIYAGLFLGDVRQRSLSIASLFDSVATIDNDLMVPFGTSATITANIAYDTVTVNGDLTIAQGVTLTAAKFFVSQNNSGNRATVTLLNNARITMPSWTGGDGDIRCVVGDGSPASLTLNAGSSFTLTEMRLARGINTAASDGQTPVQVVLNDATLDVSYEFTGRAGWSGESWCVSLNGPNAVLNAANFNFSGYPQSSRVRFNGGLLKFEKKFTKDVGCIRLPNGNQHLALESVNGNPLRFACTGDYVGNSTCKGLFQMTWGGTIQTTGSGAFQVERLMTKPVPLLYLDNPGRSDQHLAFGHTGGFRVLGGASMKLDSYSTTMILNMADGANDLVMEAGSLVDLNGTNVTFNAIASAGTITNTSSTAATLTVGANGGDAVFGIAPSVPVVKTGAGSLRIPDGSMANVSVQGGTLDLCDRAAVGYPYYRFKVLGPKSNIRLSEFALYDGVTDVTARRSAISEVTEGGWHNAPPSNLADGDFSTKWDNRCLGNTSNWRTNNVYFVVHYGNAPKFKHSFPADSGEADKSAVMYANAAYLASSSPMQPITAYSFAYADKPNEVAPTDWVFQGAMVGNEWRDLDRMTGFSRSGEAYSWCGTNFVAKCGLSEVSVDSLTVADNATWAIDMEQADIAVGTLTAGQNVRIVVSNAERPGASMVLPVTVSRLSGNLSTWRIVFPERPGVERGVCLDGGHLATRSEATVFLPR